MAQYSNSLNNIQCARNEQVLIDLDDIQLTNKYAIGMYNTNVYTNNLQVKCIDMVSIRNKYPITIAFEYAS